MFILIGVLAYLLLGALTTWYAIFNTRDGHWLMIPWVFIICVLAFPYMWFVIIAEKTKY